MNDSEKGSRLSRRSFGVTNRIWIILGLFVFLLTVTHFVLPTTTPTFKDTYSTANLQSKNYLNASETDPNPFQFCPVYGPDDAIGKKYGASVLSMSRKHLGSGVRIQRLINRALAGKPVTISILGGSVSACHGAGDDPISPSCYPSKFFRWWNSVFPHPATELTNGAMRRASSDYYGFCNGHHIPDVTDLVIIELDSSDLPDKTTMDNFEILVRSILLRPDQPAVLLLGHFSPQVHQTYGFTGPDHWHGAVAQFYDIPHISTKSVLFTDYMRDPKSVGKYYVDPVLASPAGHDIISDVLVAYFESQICTGWAVATGNSYDSAPVTKPQHAEGHALFGGAGPRKGVPEPGQENLKDDLDADGNRLKPDSASIPGTEAGSGVPLGMMNTRPVPGERFEEISPYCVSANDLINPLPASLFYGSGWYVYHPTTSGGTALNPAAHYWYSTLPTSKLRIPMLVGAGDIGIYYVKEPLSDVGEGSQIECWVDDNYAGAKTIENAADVGEPTPALYMIDKYVTRGSHFVECQLVGEEGQGVPMFKIIGIFSS
ncbi:hypothetical protein BDQ12DRAFT_616564 [Crucibulum laeve]|uniref:Capsular associated protein n=1 Tax=Crucibulum laeve TaxID=68775 RepID=A0A5C3LKC6_9AGAR|nr:hypothetical protein BDQ12DRAFT_616564 [Crucibulum laeve]